MKETVLKVNINCEKCKAEVMKSVSKLTGIDKITVDANKGILKVIGEVDPVLIVNQLRKSKRVAEILSFGSPRDDSNSNEVSKPETRPLPRCCDTCPPIIVGYAVYDGGFGCTIL